MQPAVPMQHCWMSGVEYAALDHVTRGAPPGLQIAALVMVGEGQQVAVPGLARRIVLVHQRGSLAQGLERVEHARQRLVLDLDQLDRLGRDVGIDGCYRRDLVAILSHLVLLQREVVAQEADPHLGRVVAGDDGPNSPELARTRGIDVLDPGVRVSAVNS